MANSTTFLPVAAYNHIEGKTIVASNTIDFSKEPTAIGDTVDVLHIPKGAFVKRAGLVVHTTEASVTLEVGDSGDADEFLAAQTLTDRKANAAAADGGAMSVDAAQKFYGAADTLRLTVGGATAASAIVTAFVEYFIVPKSRAV